MDLKERIATVMKVNQHNTSSLAELLGVQRSSLSHILNGRNNPSLDFIDKLLRNFPNVDANWLITGVDPSEKKSAQKSDIKNLSAPKRNLGTQTLSNKKRIDKIVVFYTDNSFDEYEPSRT